MQRVPGHLGAHREHCIAAAVGALRASCQSITRKAATRHNPEKCFTINTRDTAVKQVLSCLLSACSHTRPVRGCCCCYVACTNTTAARDGTNNAGQPRAAGTIPSKQNTSHHITLKCAQVLGTNTAHAASTAVDCIQSKWLQQLGLACLQNTPTQAENTHARDTSRCGGLTCDTKPQLPCDGKGEAAASLLLPTLS